MPPPPRHRPRKQQTTGTELASNARSCRIEVRQGRENRGGPEPSQPRTRSPSWRRCAASRAVTTR